MLSKVIRRARPSWYVDSSPSRMSRYRRVLPTPSSKHACRGETERGSRSLPPLRPVSPGWVVGMRVPLFSSARGRLHAQRNAVIRCPPARAERPISWTVLRPSVVCWTLVRSSDAFAPACGWRQDRETEAPQRQAACSMRLLFRLRRDLHSTSGALFQAVRRVPQLHDLYSVRCCSSRWSLLKVHQCSSFSLRYCSVPFRFVAKP